MICEIEVRPYFGFPSSSYQYIILNITPGLLHSPFNIHFEEWMTNRTDEPLDEAQTVIGSVEMPGRKHSKDEDGNERSMGSQSSRGNGYKDRNFCQINLRLKSFCH